MDILELLKKYGFELDEEKKSEFNSEFRKSFKSAAELKKVKDELADVKDELAEANSTIEENRKSSKKGSETEEQLKKEVEDYKAELANIKFDTLLNKGLNGIEFANARVKESIIAEIKGKDFKEKDGQLDGLADYLKDLYKNEPDNFKAVDSSIHTWGSSQDDSNNNGGEEKKYGNLFGRIV